MGKSFVLSLLFAGTVLCVFGCASFREQGALTFERQTLTSRTLPFRGYLQGYPSPDEDVFWDKGYWEARFLEWEEEGFNVVVWYGPGELTNGDHLLVRHERFPEARMISETECESRIEMMSWLFDTAHHHGIKNLLLTQPIFFTQAFGEAHDLMKEMPVSESVYKRHNSGYPNFWPGENGPALVKNCGVRNEITRAYTEAVYFELLETYEHLDGFYGFFGEPLPGDRAAFFKEAIAPALRASGKNPLFLACQWETPIDSFMDNVVPEEIYDNSWLGFHGHNSEVITDAKPYPGLIHWSEVTGLPTVTEIYPANAQYLPFNSPKFAHEIVVQTKNVEGMAGFIYSERYTSGTRFGPLFRKALAHYAKTGEEYSDTPWLEILSAQFGSEKAAKHFLDAYNTSGRIVPEMCALVYSGSDVLQRSLRMPYDSLITPKPWSFMTSPARGEHLVPIQHYARFFASNPNLYGRSNGSDHSIYPHFTRSVWNPEGGSVFAITPPVHMDRIRKMGEECMQHAKNAMPHVRKNQDDVQLALDFMIGFDHLSDYYQKKVLAAIWILASKQPNGQQYRARAKELAKEALESYKELVSHFDNHLSPTFGGSMSQRGKNLSQLLEDELEDYELAMQSLKK